MDELHEQCQILTDIKPAVICLQLTVQKGFRVWMPWFYDMNRIRTPFNPPLALLLKTSTDRQRRPAMHISRLYQ